MKPSENYGPWKAVILRRIKTLGYKVVDYRIPTEGETLWPVLYAAKHAPSVEEAEAYLRDVHPQTGPRNTERLILTRRSS